MSDLDRRIVSGAPLVLGRRMMLAHEALLRFAGECIEDGWPDVRSCIRFAAAYRVDAQELAAMCGIVSYRLTPRGKLVWCDGWRHPDHVRMTSPAKLSRGVLRGYGYYVAAATLAGRARSIH